MVLPDRIELSASPLPRECSTTELRQLACGAYGRPRRGLYCHRANLDARPKNAYWCNISRSIVPGTRFHSTMSKTEQANQREQRLAAKLRENLKRRKTQAKARSDSEGQAPAVETAPETGMVNKP